jgi:hypothetical protein
MMTLIPFGSGQRHQKGTRAIGFKLGLMPGKSYNVLLRLYGPLEPWFDKTWKPGDFELVE